jgi:hypothetical protein
MIKDLLLRLWYLILLIALILAIELPLLKIALDHPCSNSQPNELKTPFKIPTYGESCARK